AAGAGNLWRLSRWRGLAARRDALVLVLHAGFFFAAAGFLAAGAAALWPSRIPYAAGVHVWAIGAIGVMTLAMMTRATLGHSGRALVASRGTRFAYFCVVAALVLRLAMAFLPDFALPLMDAAAGAWILAFAAFLIVYAPMLTRPAGPA
ncbi:MAG TPA: NnrS family protein, partial [Roseiarcus sp.]|nr:NnrS family protein [Roseiarcus sp.]